MPDQEIPPPRKRRWALRLVAGAVGLLGVVIVVLVIAARGIDPDDLARWLEPRMEAATGRTVDIAAARVALFPPVAVALEDVTIHNPEGVAGDPFISVEELRLDVSLMQLLRRRIRIDEIRLQGPQVRVVVDEDGRSNAEGFGTGATRETVRETTPDAGSGAPFQVDIESIRIDDATLSYRDVGKGSAFVVAPLAARTRVRSEDGDRWTLETSASARIGARLSESASGRVGPWDVEIEGSGSAQDEFRTIRLDEGQFRVEELAFSLTAGLDRDEQGGGGYRASIMGEDLDAARLVSLMPDSTLDARPDLGGRLSVNLGVSGTLGSGVPPVIDGSVDLEEVYIAAADQAPMLTGLRGTWFMAGDSVWTTETEGVALGGPLRVRGLVRLGDVSGFVMRVAAQPDLGGLGSVVTLPDSVTVSGALALDVTARGTLANPAEANLSGRLMPENVSLTLPGVAVPVGLPSGTVILGAEGARWSDLPVRLGADAFVSTGGLADWAAWTRGDGSVPVLDGSFAGDRFDMDAVFPAPPPDSTVLYGKLVFAQLGDRRIRDRTPGQILEARGIFRPDSLPLGGEVRMSFGTFLSAPYALSDVRARVEFGPRLVRVHDVVAGAYGGTVRADVSLGLGRDAEPFSLRFTAEDVQAAPFLSATSPLGRFVSGLLSVDVDVSGDMDRVYLPSPATLLGSGSFSLKGGTLHANAVTDALSRFFDVPELRQLSLDDWTAPLLLREGRVVLQESTVRGAFGEPRVAGSVGFGGQLALNLLYRLPAERLDSAALARTGVGAAVIRRVQSSGVPLDAVLRVAGSVLDPRVSADPSAVGQSVAGALQAEVESEIQGVIEERREELQQRAEGLVDRLIPRADTTTVRGLPGVSDLRRLLPGRRSSGVPPDTASPRPDTLAAVPDTTRADSVPATDSIRPDTVPEPGSPSSGG